MKRFLLRFGRYKNWYSMVALHTIFVLDELISYRCPWVTTLGDHVQTLAVFLYHQTEASQLARFPKWPEKSQVFHVTLEPINGARWLPAAGPFFVVFDRSIWMDGYMGEIGRQDMRQCG